MSLLGISIDPALTKQRLENPLGFVEETNDEALLKQLGAIVLEKGMWTPKYKGPEVAELLNWIAGGRPTGGLPALAKRLLCLKREKLDRSKKDARSASYARANADKWIKEIDAIFSQEKEPVECVVDIIEEPCNSNNGDKAPNAAVDGPLVSKPPGPDAPGGSNMPKAFVGSNMPKKSNAPPPNPASGSATVTTVTQATPSASQPASQPAVTGPSGKPAHEEVVKPPALTVDNPITPILQFVVNFYKTLGDTEIKIRIEKLIAMLFILSLRDPVNIEGEAKAKKGWDSGTGEEDEQRVTKLLDALEIAEAKPSAPAPNEKAVEVRIAAAVAEAIKGEIGPRRYTCSDRVSCLQQLVFTTCGEASLLDPLIDHLNKLFATLTHLSVQSSSSTNAADRIAELKTLIEAKAGDLQTSLKTNATKESLKSMLAGFESELTALETKNTGGVTNTERTKLKSEITRIKDLLAASDPLGEKDQFIAQLEEELRLLTILLTTIDNGSELFKPYTDFKEEIAAQLAELRSSNSNIRQSMAQACNKRAFTYRSELEKAKADESSSSAEAIATEKRVCEDRITELETKHTTTLAQQETRYKTEITTLTERIEVLTSEKQKCEAQVAALQVRADAAEAAKTAANAKANTSTAASHTKDARITSLEAELAALRKECEGIKEKAAASNGKNTDLAALRAQLEEARAALEGERRRCDEIARQATAAKPAVVPPPPPLSEEAPPPPPEKAPLKPVRQSANIEIEKQTRQIKLKTAVTDALSSALTGKSAKERAISLISIYESKRAEQERRLRSGKGATPLIKQWHTMEPDEREALTKAATVDSPIRFTATVWNEAIAQLEKDRRVQKRGGTRKHKTFGCQTRKLHK